MLFSTHNSSSSARVRLARNWLVAFTHWDLNAVYSFMTDSSDFVYNYLPASIGIAPKSRAEWHKYNVAQKAILPNFTVRLSDDCCFSPQLIFGVECEVLDIYDSTGPVVAHVRVNIPPSISRLLRRQDSLS